VFTAKSSVSVYALFIAEAKMIILKRMLLPGKPAIIPLFGRYFDEDRNG
jgi:hypothetical protein